MKSWKGLAPKKSQMPETKQVTTSLNLGRFSSYFLYMKHAHLQEIKWRLNFCLLILIIKRSIPPWSTLSGLTLAQKLKPLHGLWPLRDGQFSKCTHFTNIWSFLERFFAQNNCKWFVEWILTCFLEFSFLIQSEDYAKAISFAWLPIFKMVSFFGYLGFSQAVFLQRTTLNDL